MIATPERIPLNTLAIAFGLAGLAEAWSTAGDAIGLSPIVGQVFWVIAAVAWVWLIAAHLRRGVHTTDRLIDQLRHPVQGPIAALVPITGMLLAGDLLAVSRLLSDGSAAVIRVTAVALFLTFLVLAGLFAAWLIAHWLRGGLALESVHGGYLLPTVAAGLVGAAIAADADLTELSSALLGAGGFFWVVMTVIVVIRLAFRPTQPGPLVPTTAILVAPPAVAGIALFAEGGLVVRPAALEVAGIGILLVLVQLALIPQYRRLTFSLGFWSFTFPSAAVVTVSIDWLRIATPFAWQLAALVLVAALTGLVVIIAAKSLLPVFNSPARAAVETTMTAADDSAAVHAH